MEQRTVPKIALVGIISSFPAVLIVLAGSAQSLLGLHQISDALDALYGDPTFAFMKVLVHPVVILGGLMIAFVLNTIPVCRITFNQEEKSINLKILLRDRQLNLLVIAGSLVVLGILLSYAAVENFQIIAQ